MLILENYFIEKGIEKGFEKGIEKGIEKGKIEKNQANLLKLMKKKFNLTKEDEILIKKCTNEKKLDEALEFLLFSDNKESVLKILK